MPSENPENIEDRVQAFNAELIPLLAKHKLGLGAVPQLVQMENGGFAIFAKPQLFDDTKKPPKAEDKKDGGKLSEA